LYTTSSSSSSSSASSPVSPENILPNLEADHRIECPSGPLCSDVNAKHFVQYKHSFVEKVIQEKEQQHNNNNNNNNDNNNHHDNNNNNNNNQNQNNQFLIERIVDETDEEYFVKWKGYHDENNSWEAKEAVNGVAPWLVTQFYEEQQKKYQLQEQSKLCGTEMEIYKWLEIMRLQEYVQNFVKNGYCSMKDVSKIQNDEQLVQIGISKKGHQKRILKFVEGFNNDKNVNH